MAAPNLPKSVLLSPGQSEKNSEEIPCASSVKTFAKFQEVLKINVSQGTREVQQNRMKNLRKELDYLKETEWKYEPIEKYIGQSSN